MTVQEGGLLGERYVMDARIASGGMGEVWRGYDQRADAVVAIKVLKDDAHNDVTFLRRFRNEAKNAARLDHPNVARVLDYGDSGAVAYLVMEFIDAEPMSTILERERVLPEDRLVHLMRETCRGLDVAHRSGVIHRDIKPGNLMVLPEDHVKITDFGVSRSTDQTTLTATGMVMGTAQYLAPELALGRPASPASDLYALGIIAYESVTGKRPFVAASPVDIAIAQVNDDVPPLPPHVSPSLAALIMDLLEKSPRRRPRTAMELDKQLASLKLSGNAPKVEAVSILATPEPARPERPAMPPSIAPKRFRPRPDSPGKGPQSQ